MPAGDPKRSGTRGARWRLAALALALACVSLALLIVSLWGYNLVPWPTLLPSMRFYVIPLVGLSAVAALVVRATLLERARDENRAVVASAAIFAGISLGVSGFLWFMRVAPPPWSGP